MASDGDKSTTSSQAEQPDTPRALSREQILHLLTTFLLALVVLAFAAALSAVAIWMSKNSYPSFLIFGCRIIAIFCFTTDAIVVCGTTAIITFQILREMFELDSKKQHSKGKR